MTEHLNITKERHRQIQSVTAQDESLQTLTSVIMAGWPETRDATPIIVAHTGTIGTSSAFNTESYSEEAALSSRNKCARRC